MKLPKACMIELCVTKDENRYGMHDPYFEAGCLTATDGHRAAMVEVQWDKTDLPGYVPRELIKAARAATQNGEEIYIDLSDPKVAKAMTKHGVVSMQRTEDVTFPNVHRVIKPERIFDIRIMIDPFLLLDLAKALGTRKGHDGIEMIIDVREFKEAIIDPTILVNEQGFGLLMPCRVDVSDRDITKAPSCKPTTRQGKEVTKGVK